MNFRPGGTRAVLAITGQDRLLDNNPVIQQSILERNGDTDVINALQVELLRRWRESGEDQDLKTLILLSVNAPGRRDAEHRAELLSAAASPIQKAPPQTLNPAGGWLERVHFGASSPKTFV